MADLVANQNFDSNPNHVIQEPDTLNVEDKVRIWKGLILIFFISTVVASSIIYYNAPNFNPNLVFEMKHDKDVKHDYHNHNFPVYRLNSRFSNEKYIQYDILLERKGRENPIISEPVRNLKMIVKFSKNRAYIRIEDVKIDTNLDEDNAGREQTSSRFRIPYNYLYDNNDLTLETDGRLDNIADSNLGINVLNHPFGFRIFRKDTNEVLFDTTHSFESTEITNHLFIADQYLQISTKLPKNHYTYGLEERSSQKLRLTPGEYTLWNRDPDPMSNMIISEKEDLSNYYSSFPAYMSINPTTKNACGVLMMNSSPMNVIVKEESLSFKMASGVIELYVFNGPRPKEVIMQLQMTLGKPLLPPYSALNWQANLVTSDPVKDLGNFVNSINLFNGDNSIQIEEFSMDYDKILSQDEQLSLYNLSKNLQTNSDLKIHIYKKSAISKNNNEDLVKIGLIKDVFIKDNKGQSLVSQNSEGECYFIDYFSPNAITFTKNVIADMKFFSNYTSHNDNNQIVFKNIPNFITIYGNEPSQYCDGYCNNTKPNTDNLNMLSDFSTIALNKNTLPNNSKQTGNENYVLLNTHNLYPLQEVKTYFTALKDMQVDRPVIFSRSGFIGINQYAGKWIGYLSGWNGLQTAIRQTMKQNILGNPNVIHEACGYTKNRLTNNISRTQIFDFELCIRWLEVSSVFTFARFNFLDVMHIQSKDDKKKIEKILKIRLNLSAYLMSYMINNSLFGGSFIRPMFIDFATLVNKNKDLMDMTSQFMMGTNMMVAPVITAGERRKMVYFPSDKFFDFEEGKLMNPNGEDMIAIDAPIDKLLLFLRAGSIVHVQNTNEANVGNIKSVTEMRKLFLQLKIGLDDNSMSYGRILIDDGYSSKFKTNNEYYRMDINAILISDKEDSFIQIIFRVNPNNKYYISNNEFPGINKISIFGFNKLFIKKILIISLNKNPIELTSKTNYEYDSSKETLILKNINIAMTEDTKLIIE